MNDIIFDLSVALSPVKFAKELGFNPDPWQVKVLTSSSKRLILNCSRQSGKSTTASVLALQRAIYYPNNLILLVSPSLRQSSELFRKVGEQLDRLNVKPKLIEDNKLSCTFENKSRIVSLPSSEGTIRGYSGASLIIEDEASRVDDELYRAIRPMLAVSDGRLILMSTPFGKRGHFHQEWSEGLGWEKIEIKASDCPRISSGFLEEEKKSLGDWWFQQEYMCKFVESVDQIFHHDLVMGSITPEVRPLFDGGEI